MVNIVGKRVALKNMGVDIGVVYIYIYILLKQYDGTPNIHIKKKC